MVKNSFGGNKTKGMARKMLQAPKSKKLRVSEIPEEVYGRVENVLGNGTFNVYCIDKVLRLGHIRGKFKGRGKRDNTVKKNGWVLIGLTDWGKSANSKKIEHCELLEVYSDDEVEKLKIVVTDVNWKIIIPTNLITGQVDNEDNDGFVFMDEQQRDYFDMMNSQKKEKLTEAFGDDTEHINVDDI